MENGSKMKRGKGNDKEGGTEKKKGQNTDGSMAKAQNPLNDCVLSGK